MLKKHIVIYRFLWLLQLLYLLIKGTIRVDDRYFKGTDEELDLFNSPNPNLILAEVEFPSEEAADSFQPPNWFGKEITNDEKYNDYNLINSK